MLTVIVVTGEAAERLPALLAALASATVEGLVRQVILVGDAPAELMALLREETGADLAPGLAEAVAAAKSERLLVLPGDFRPGAGWTQALARGLREDVTGAVVEGDGGRFLRPAPWGVLIARRRAAALAHPDLKRLRRELGRAAPRLR
jgi:hypothetical protein